MNAELITVHLGLGSNLGDRKANLDQALGYLSHRLRVAKVSSVYDTEPVGNPNQPRFLNMVCQVETMIGPEALLILLKGVEQKIGRLPGKPNSPRPIDIDILFYGNRVINTPALVIPHPKLTERAFVLVPLAEIAPTLVHPVNKKNIEQLLGELKKGVQGVLKLE